jgi:hypothetical protein
LGDKWHCSRCSFTHEDFEKVVGHENKEHGCNTKTEKRGEFAGKSGDIFKRNVLKPKILTNSQ